MYSGYCDTLARWLEAVSSTLVEMVTRTRKLPGRQEVLPCCGEDVVDIDCSALHRASNFIFFRVRFCVDGRGAASGLGLVEDRHDFETESTTGKMQVGKKGKELKGRNCEKVPSPARCALRTSSTVGKT